MSNVEFAYGRDGLTVDMPRAAELTRVEKPAVYPPATPAEQLQSALGQPLGLPPLAEAAATARSACIVVCDITRPVPNALFLRPLIDILLKAGVPRDGITVLIATGLHRPGDAAEVAEVIGDPWVAANIRVVNHDARDATAQVFLGETSERATPIGLNRLFVDADVRIATGLVEPHFMAGYSGGRKVIAPGIAHESTIRTFHSARFMEDPAARSCNLSGNPLHEEQLAILDCLPGSPVYGLNTVLDAHRQLVALTFGAIRESHAAAVEVAERIARPVVTRRFQTVVTSAAGYPLDNTYYQTVKSMVTPLDILTPGGTLIVAAACAEGLGSAEYERAQRSLIALGPGAFVASLLAKRFADIDEWQTEMQVKAVRAGDVALYAPRLPVDAPTGVRRIECIASEVAASIERHGDSAVAVIPEGAYVVPRLASGGVA